MVACRGRPLCLAAGDFGEPGAPCCHLAFEHFVDVGPTEGGTDPGVFGRDVLGGFLRGADLWVQEEAFELVMDFGVEVAEPQSAGEVDDASRRCLEDDRRVLSRGEQGGVDAVPVVDRPDR